MLRCRILFALLLSLPVALPVRAQEEKPKIVDGQLVITPDVAERARRRSERLQNPSFIKLAIAPLSHCLDEGSRKISGCYRASSKIRVELFMTNTSAEPITFTTGSDYFHYDLRLFRDGKLVPYRKDITCRVGQPPAAIYCNISVKLEPGKKEKVDALGLGDWYEALGAGHYRLDIKRRFQSDGGWTDTSSATFEVAP